MRKSKNRNWQGRPIGESHGRALMTENQVREVRRKYIPYVYPIERLAKEYNVSRGCISNIVARHTWSWLPD